MPDDDSIATKTVRAPDGSPIHYPTFPGLGEAYRKPEGSHGADIHSPRQELDAARGASHEPASEIGSQLRERVAVAARIVANHVAAAASAAFSFLVKDDLEKLTGKDHGLGERIAAGADLGSWALSDGKLAEIAAHAVAKAAEITSAHLASTELEHAAAAATVAGVRDLGRALNEAEREGRFSNFEDFKRFMGPAGPDQHWHHIVEKTHVSHFEPQDIHNIDNVVSLPAQIHVGKEGVSPAFTHVNPLTRTSLREDLRGQPIEAHVGAGEQALRDRGYDPNALRAETRARFEQRLLEHDRKSIARDAIGGVALTSAAGAFLPEPAGAAPIVERAGLLQPVAPGQAFSGRVERVDGDTITQHLGRGATAVWSLADLRSHLTNPPSLDGLRPGSSLGISVDRAGGVNIQQRQPGQGWESLTAQPIAPWQQYENQRSPGQHFGLDRGLGR